MKTKWLETALNLLFWACTAWFIVSNFSIQSQEIIMESNGYESLKTVRNYDLINHLLFNVGIAGALFYTHFYLILRINKGAKIGTIVLLSIGVFLLAFGLTFSLPKLFFSQVQAIYPFGLSFGILFFYYAVSTGYGIGKLWLAGEAQRQRLILEKKQAELNLLRLQLHPHFLFNVLNNLLSMVDQQKNPKIAETIDRLSGMLRYVVYETTNEQVALEKEIHFIQDYAELQLMRFEPEEVDFQLSVQGENWGQSVEPGLFISFVENAFKHGVQAEEQSFIHLNFDLRQSGKVIFTIVNSMHTKSSPQEIGGTGLAATRERLKLVYPNRHQLILNTNEAFYIKLELDTYENHHS